MSSSADNWDGRLVEAQRASSVILPASLAFALSGRVALTTGLGREASFDRQIEVLSHFVFADDLGHGEADAVLAAQARACAWRLP